MKKERVSGHWVSFLVKSGSSALLAALSAGLGCVASGGSTCSILSVVASVHVYMRLLNSMISLCFILNLIRYLRLN